MLKHLPLTCQPVLTSIFNKVWEYGTFPPAWREATVIPIPKPGKDHSDPINYRPIALTSCLCKTMERMVNDRLVWYLESNYLITDYQCGFRHRRCTQDHLIRLEAYIRDAFVKREHVVAVFFDLEKAYDTTWKYGILKDLHDFGMRGRLPSFISCFLKDRHFQVRVGSTLSSLHDQEMGVPQVSILSVTCFSIKINSIVKSIKSNIMCSLYVDDFLVAFRSKQMATIERQLQLNLNNLNKWSVENGFKFSKSKTVCMHFCHLRNLHHDPELTIDNTPIKVVKETKFLGLIFDSKLSFIPHITMLKTKCLKSLNLLKVVSKMGWGGDTTVLLNLYRAITRSRLDYGSIVYGSARPSYLKPLNTVHHLGLRLCLRAFRTSPVESLYVLANETSLELRRIKLSMQYVTKLSASSSNPAYDCVFHPDFQDIYYLKPNAIRPLGLRMKPHLEFADIDSSVIARSEIPPIPPWTIRAPTVILDLGQFKKSETDPIIYQQQFDVIRSNLDDYLCIFTDGSKDGGRVACGVFLNGLHCTGSRLPDNCSIYTAELTAIMLALECVEDTGQSNFLICSDSMSSLQALQNKIFDHPLVKSSILVKYLYLTRHYEIVFCWTPGHVGIAGNETPKLTLSALGLSLVLYSSGWILPLNSLLPSRYTPACFPYSDLKPVINGYIMSQWQGIWDECIDNKLNSVQPVLSDRLPACQLPRRDQVVLNRLQIGHSRLTHAYLLLKSPWGSGVE